MNQDLYEDILDAVKDRSSWEKKQDLWYRLRNGQIGRSTKPYPGAPDMRSRLGDSLEEKIKPFYVQQIYSSDTIPSMVALRQQDTEITSGATNWFDYKLKQQSNFEREIYNGIDSFLEGGFCPMKVYWDSKKKQLAFDACDRLHVIVPKGTQEYKEADWLVHVLHMSVAQYRANNTYKQDDEFIKSITGKGNHESSNSEAKLQSEYTKEGITYGQNDDQIVLWETYCRPKGSRQIYIETCSPLRHKDEVRPRFKLPYNQHVFKGGDCPPFIKVRTEINGKSYYAPRGVIELVAPWETSLNKSLNAQHEWMDHFNQPAYRNTGSGMVGNTKNFQRGPGAILPQGLEPVDSPSPPISFAEDIGTLRAWAEYRINIPDLGSGNHLMGQTQGKDTATKINAILGQSGQVNDIRARVFRLDLGDLLKMSWSLLLQYDVDSTEYVNNDGDLQTLDKSAFHEQYDITPNGSPDSWNKGAQMQQAVALFQLLQGNPFVKQDELTKMLLEAKDSRLVKTLFTDPNQQSQDQTEHQAQEISLMLLGFPTPVNPSDDDKTHISTMGGFFQRRLQTGEPITPELARLALTHGSDHDNQLAQKKDPALAQIRQQIAPLIQILQQIAAQPDPRESNVVPMQQGMAGPTGQSQPSANATSLAGPVAPGTPKPIDPVAVGNMLANLMGKGVPVTHDDVNAVLAKVGLPPIQTAAPMVPPVPQIPNQQLIGVGQ